jgi:signal transduction histidine kinase
MNAIIGFSQLLENVEKEEKRKEYSRIILENGRYLMHLIEDILDISKIESNQLEIIYTNFSVHNLLTDVEQVLSQYLIRIEKPQLQLINESAQNDLILYSDKYRIKQVLTNLLSNAAKFTQIGTIRFGYKVTPGNIEFYVEDSGFGIAKEHLDEIFDRFRKINPPEDARYYRGTGIGLSISKQIIELLGGKISVESTYSKGSRFSFTIPNQASPKHFTPNSGDL